MEEQGRSDMKARRERDEMDALGAAYATSMSSRTTRNSGPSKYSAAQSHHMNDAHMEEWERAYEAMHGPRSIRSSNTNASHPSQRRTMRTQTRPGLPNQTSKFSSGITGEKMRITHLSTRWNHGPQDAAGSLIDLSDRPLLCMSVDIARGEAVIGGSDHALYCVDINKGIKGRTLYTKRYGHSEWVTCVTHLPDGRVVSGAMDAKLCVWDRGGIRCMDLEGHFGSVSCVDTAGSIIVSAGYDKSVYLWDSNTGAVLSHTKAHKAPILTLSAQLDRAATGDRDGQTVIWDIHTGNPITTLSGHKGHLTSLHWFGAPDDPNSLLVTGAQDGHIRIWDCRNKEPIANIPAHTSEYGSGAVGDIGSTTSSNNTADNEVIVTAGADKTLCVLDPRLGFDIQHRFTQHKDFVYTLHVTGSIAFSGSGDGMLLATDVKNHKPLWALGANKAAVRCIGVTNEKLIATGDDGNALVYTV